MPPSDIAYPRKCLPVAATPSRELALHAAHVRDAEAAHEIGRLAVGLLHPAPPGVPCDIEDRRQRVAGTGGDHLLTDDGADALDQLRVPRRREPDRLGELRRVACAQPRRALLVHDRRDAEPGVLDEIVLDRVGEFRRSRDRKPVVAPILVISPIPCASHRSAAAGEKSSSRINALHHTQPSCASFSSRVIRASSASRSVIAQ